MRAVAGMRRAAGCAALLALLAPGSALAHDGLPPAPHDLAGAWALDPPLLALLALAAWGYGRGLRALWGRAGAGRGVEGWRALAFVGGVLALAAALVSPLDALGHALFSGHMAQHTVLILVAAPLVALGRPGVVGAWAARGLLRRGPLRGLLRGLARALGAASALPLSLGLHVATLWLWHAPMLYQLALVSDLAHKAEHACFFGAALLFWQAALRGRGGQYGASVLALFALALQGTLLGALMTFAPSPWYPAYEGSTAAWGLTPLEDQQIAGLIMWLPAGIVYVLAALGLFAAWLRATERRSEQLEARAAARGRP